MASKDAGASQPAAAADPPRPGTRAQSKKRAALGDISNRKAAPAAKQGKYQAPSGAVVAVPAAAPAPAVAPVAAAPPAPEAPTVLTVVAPEAPAIVDIDKDEGTKPFLDYVADHFTYLRSLEVRPGGSRASLACLTPHVAPGGALPCRAHAPLHRLPPLLSRQRFISWDSVCRAGVTAGFMWGLQSCAAGVTPTPTHPHRCTHSPLSDPATRT
jgi:hypothetical protein